eukprot:scaffold15389_cov131-Isochrysis_galbana.AAC.5
MHGQLLTNPTPPFSMIAPHLQAEKSYMGTLATSMALMLEEFYSGLTTVGLSARTGIGVDAFFDAVQVPQNRIRAALE